MGTRSKMGRKAIKLRKEARKIKRRNRRIKQNSSMGKMVDTLAMGSFVDIMSGHNKRRRPATKFRRDRACNSSNLEKVENILLQRRNMVVAHTQSAKPFSTQEAPLSFQENVPPQLTSTPASSVAQQTAVTMPPPLMENPLQNLPGFSMHSDMHVAPATYTQPLLRVPMTAMPDSAILKELAFGIKHQPQEERKNRG